MRFQRLAAPRAVHASVAARAARQRLEHPLFQPLHRPLRLPFLAALLLLLPPRVAPGQPTAPSAADSARRATADSATRRLEGMVVRAIRGGDAAPVAQTTIDRAGLAARHFGQEPALLLQQAAPSLTAHTETGTPWGYGYVRLRGVDQTRLNITLDGVPLNDMEDQVLYFANFADLLGGVQSVQVQRGVGTSSNGTAGFAGSINLETRPAAGRARGGGAALQWGSFGATRLAVEAQTGTSARGFSAFARASALRTNGFRDHSGLHGRSALVNGAWVGDRDVVKLTVLAGLFADTLSYVGATSAQLAQNRRFNPLAPDERDRFGQQMVALGWSRALASGTTVNTTVYRNSALGNYDWFDLPDRYRFNLQHQWYGVTSTATREWAGVRLQGGVNANRYWRAHRGYLQPATALYDNRGHKADASGFAKLAVVRGRAEWFVDAQGRWARFRYQPDANAQVDARAVDWAFLNPKAGVSVTLAPGARAFASYGSTGREPARSDLFAGEDDLNAGNVDAIGDFRRVRPERVGDLELGVSLARAGGTLAVTAYRMDFRNDIARIGAPTASGIIPRRNVGASVRQGVELEGSWTPVPRVTLAGHAAWSDNRIRQFTDSSRGTPRVLTNVAPMLTPRFISAHRVTVRPSSPWEAGVEGRYQSRAFLDNTSSPDRVLPDYYTLDATVRWAPGDGRRALVVRGQNLGNTQKFGSGAVSSSGRVRYFVLPARAVYVTAEVGF
ncbi:MAG: hypothetical protein RLZ32_196 [Gemmatimonadota bacterium]